MTYTEYLDGTSKAAVHALVVELEDAVRGASERAVAGSLDRIEGALRRLENGDAVLRQELEAAAERLPERVESLLAGAIAQAAQPQGGRLDEVFAAVERLDGALGRVTEQVHQHRRAGEQDRTELQAALSRLAELQGQSGDQWRRTLETALQETGLTRLSTAMGSAAEVEAERFTQLSGWLGHVREALAALGDQSGRLEHQVQDLLGRQGVAQQAVEVLSGRLGAMAEGMDEALSQFRSLEQAQARGFSEVRQAIEAMDAAQGQRIDHLTAEVGQLKEALASGAGQGPVSQLREEAQTRHDAVIRMLENLNGRVIFDVEANNKALIMLEKLRGQTRWHTRLAVVVACAVLILFGYVFFGNAMDLGFSAPF